MCKNCIYKSIFEIFNNHKKVLRIKMINEKILNNQNVMCN